MMKKVIVMEDNTVLVEGKRINQETTKSGIYILPLEKVKDVNAEILHQERKITESLWKKKQEDDSQREVRQGRERSEEILQRGSTISEHLREAQERGMV